MSDINSYSREQLEEFLDAVHESIVSILSRQYGDTWFSDAVEKSMPASLFDRTKQMLTNPMRVVDLEGREEDELYGVEHIGNIVEYNWDLFPELQQNKTRTLSHLGEIAELRHNLSHKRKKHRVRREDLLRQLQNMATILAATGNASADIFNQRAFAISQGSSPWGEPLPGTLPPAVEMYQDWVERSGPLTELEEWIDSEHSQIALIGYGGTGKSAVAHRFVKTILQAGGHSSLKGVCWATGKQSEYVDGASRSRNADFIDIESLVAALLTSLYGETVQRGEFTTDDLLAELRENPCLVVIDDVDTIQRGEDWELKDFLMHDLRVPGNKILYTSRTEMTAVRSIQVPGLNEIELSEFLRSHASLFNLDIEKCLDRQKAIASVTDSYPLFVIDLLRFAGTFGLPRTIEDWTQRRGDAAREYSLKAQVDHITASARDTFMALSVSNRPLSTIEICQVASLTEDDVMLGLDTLTSYSLAFLQGQDVEENPLFTLNQNTRRLAQRTYSRDPSISRYQVAFRGLANTPAPRMVATRIEQIKKRALHYKRLREYENAVSEVETAMVGDLEHHPELYGLIGYLYSTQENHLNEARKAFRSAHQLGTNNPEIYHRWSRQEVDIGNRLAEDKGNGDEISTQWESCEEILFAAIEKCGEYDYFTGTLAYVLGRCGNYLKEINRFDLATNKFQLSLEWNRKTLRAITLDTASYNKKHTFIGLIEAYAGLEEYAGMEQVFREWSLSPNVDREQLINRFDRLSRAPSFVRLLNIRGELESNMRAYTLSQVAD